MRLVTVRRAPPVVAPARRRGRSVGVSSVALFRAFSGRLRRWRLFVWSWRLMGLYGLDFAPWRVLRCALRVPLPFSRRFLPSVRRSRLRVCNYTPEKKSRQKGRFCAPLGGCQKQKEKRSFYAPLAFRPSLQKVIILMFLSLASFVRASVINLCILKSWQGASLLAFSGVYVFPYSKANFSDFVIFCPFQNSLLSIK
jgi:hypothetical protein